MPSVHFMSEIELNLLRKTFELALSARAKGNHPFGALLADKAGKILLTAENTVVSEKDVTGHAETNLIREASRKFTAEELADATIYASCEPCPMCAGAIFWANIGRVVFALPAEKLYQIVDAANGDRFFISLADVFAQSTKAVEIKGGFLEREAAAVHENFKY